MKVALAQIDIIWENKSENIRKCEEFFKEASVSECDLLVFPELTLTGFSMNLSLCEDVHNSESLAFFQNCCRDHAIGCVFGYGEKSDDNYYNELVYIDRKGTVIEKYRKLHPFTYGGEIYSAGNDVASFDFDGNDIGLSICYDLRFPEVYQQLSKKCGCIIVAANWPEARREHWITLLRARAIENQCYVIGCNRVGVTDNIAYSGDSTIIDPNGAIVVSAESNKEQLLCCEIDLNIAKKLRSDFPVKKDRRTDLYRNFYE